MITQCLYTLDYPGQQFGTNVQSGVVGWTVTKQKLCPQIIIHQAHSGKGALPPYRETIDNDDNSIASPDSFHSIEDDGERDDNQSAQDDMILL